MLPSNGVILFFNEPAREVPSPFMGRDESAVLYLGRGQMGDSPTPPIISPDTRRCTV